MLPGIDRFLADLIHSRGRGRRAAGGGRQLVGRRSPPCAPPRTTSCRWPASIAISPAGFGHQPWVDFFEREPIIHRIVNAPVPLPAPLIRLAARTLYPRVALHDRSGSTGP